MLEIGIICFRQISVSNVPCLANNDTLREYGIKNAEAAKISVSVMIESAEEAGIAMIVDLVNQVIVKKIISIEWELSTIVNCYKGKGDAPKRGNYRGLKLTDQILKKVKVGIDKEQLDTDEIQLQTPFLSSEADLGLLQHPRWRAL